MGVAGLALAAGCSGGGGSDTPVAAAAPTTTLPPTTLPPTTTTTRTTLPPTTVRPTTTTTIAKSVPAGYTGFTDETSHFSISVPTSWRKVDPTSPGATQALQDLVKANPGFASLVGSGDLASSGMRFLAADPATGASVNVVVRSAIGATDADLKDVLDALKPEYASVGLTLVSSRTVTLAGHSALEITVGGSIKATPSAPATTVHEVQDIVAANDFLYILTRAGTDKTLASIAATFRV